jgi:hypothetical protein
MAAAGSLAAVAFASTTTIGIDRLMQATGQLQEAIYQTGNKPLRPLDGREGQRLVEAVRLLTEERDRLLTRIGAVEQQVESITGSVARVSKVAEAASKAAEAAAAERATSALLPLSADAPAANEPTASVNSAAAGPAGEVTQELSASAIAGKSEFGLDIGGGTTIEALRVVWAKSRQQHASSLEGLRPIVHLRENRRGGTVELRLLAGPLPSAVAAAKICAKLNAVGAACRPAVFDGQRLAAP